MKLDKREVVLRRIELLEREGVKFLCNANVGENVEGMLLLRDFDAVVCCTGATQARDLPIEGRDLKGVHLAMDFLTASTQALLDGGPESAGLHARDKDVIVIGGGDTGTDCVGTAMRQGCRSLTQIEILPRPPDDRAADNPWPEWPKVYKLDYGQEEAAARFGADPRAYVTTVKRFVAGADGALAELVTVLIRWERNAAGQFTALEQPSSERTLPAQLVLLAMGFTGPEQSLPQELGVALDARGNMQAEHGRFTTSVKGVFAAGDCRRGQSLVVWAINEGRGAARECDRFLMGRSTLP
jgi:glutamate synthase (NADPH/NADH) small chain